MTCPNCGKEVDLRDEDVWAEEDDPLKERVLCYDCLDEVFNLGDAPSWRTIKEKLSSKVKSK